MKYTDQADPERALRLSHTRNFGSSALVAPDFRFLKFELIFMFCRMTMFNLRHRRAFWTAARGMFHIDGLIFILMRSLLLVFFNSKFKRSVLKRSTIKFHLFSSHSHLLLRNSQFLISQ